MGDRPVELLVKGSHACLVFIWIWNKSMKDKSTKNHQMHRNSMQLKKSIN